MSNEYHANEMKDNFVNRAYAYMYVYICIDR